MRRGYKIQTLQVTVYECFACSVKNVILKIYTKFTVEDLELCHDTFLSKRHQRKCFSVNFWWTCVRLLPYKKRYSLVSLIRRRLGVSFSSKLKINSKSKKKASDSFHTSVSCCTSWKHRKTFGFLKFSGWYRKRPVTWNVLRKFRNIFFDVLVLIFLCVKKFGEDPIMNEL